MTAKAADRAGRRRLETRGRLGAVVLRRGFLFAVVGLLAVCPLAHAALTPLGTTPTGSGPSSVAFRPDGKLLATANDSVNTVSVFTVAADGALTGAGTTQTGGFPYSMGFSPNGKLLATANLADSTVSVFTVAAGGALTPAGTTATGTTPYSMAFSPDGKLLATANQGNNTVSVFTVAAGGALTPAGTAAASSSPVSVAFSPDGKLLAAADLVADTVSMFSVAAGGALTPAGTTATVAGPISVAFSPDGSLLATANDTGSASMFTVAAGGALAPAFEAPTGQDPESVAFSPDGSLLATANYGDSTVSIFAVTRESQSITFPPQGPYTYGQGPVTLGATASSGLPVSYTVVSGPCTVSGSTLTITGAGPCVVRADQAGNAAYLPAPPATPTITINKAATSLSATPALGQIIPPHAYAFVLQAKLTTNGAGMPGQTLVFSAGNTTICTTLTAADGTASCNALESGLAGVAILLANGYRVTYSGNVNYLSSTTRATLIQ